MAKSKEVLIFSGHSWHLGGDFKYLADLSLGLVEAGYSLRVWGDHHPNLRQKFTEATDGKIPIDILRLGPEIHPDAAPAPGLLGYSKRMLTLEWHRNILSSLLTFRKLFSSVSKDTIFLSNNGGYPGREACLWALRVAAQTSLRRSFLVVHNMANPRPRLRPMGYAYDAWVSRSIAKIIAPSDAVKMSLVKERNFSPSQISTIYCGIKSPPLLSESEVQTWRHRFSLPSGDFLIGVCGHLDEPRKGQEYALRAFSRIASSLPKGHLVFVGGAAKNRMEYFRALVSDLKLADRVHFLGPQTQMHEINSMFDLCLVPSLAMEATPYTIKEALMAARPVITTDAGGCAEGVRPGETGFVVRAGDVAELARTIESAFQNRDGLRKMGALGRQDAEGRFSLNKMIKDHIQLFEGT